jgi:hypothetical protein
MPVARTVLGLAFLNAADAPQMNGEAYLGSVCLTTFSSGSEPQRSSLPTLQDPAVRQQFNDARS